jgi:type II secretory pathway pseudopilin PulG
MNNQGVTLVELVVVMSIIIILAVALAFTYQGWQGRYKVETATKTLYTDLLSARSLATTKGRMHFADFPIATSAQTSYSIIEDANDNGVNDDAALPTFPKTVTYPMYAYSYNGPAAGAVMTAKTLTNVVISFDDKGRITSPVLLIDPSNPLDATTNVVISGILSFTQIPGPSASGSDYDCIKIEPTRISPGQMNAGVCNVK